MACALMLLGGCAAMPAGSDGNLVDDWAMLAEGKVREPVVGDCWSTNAWSAYEPGAFDYVVLADCTATHQMQTIHIGEITGTVADSAVVPARTATSGLYADCEKAAEAYLGGAWQTGLVYLYLHVPTAAQWRGGARSYRCDVAAIQSAADHIVSHDATFKDTLRPGGPLTIGCGTKVIENKLIKDLTPVECTAPHDAEFVGFVQQPNASTYPADSKGVDAVFGKACEQRLLAYTGMSAGNFDRQDIFSIAWLTAAEIGWETGDRSARCYLTLAKKVSRSFKGVGNVTV
ncbi:septum formation family protein [Dactylosporangium sp. NPDC049525]|uniref:septum formation family protein n=1 Tax=Dactylosporangium sp. NPDC049525 TaxID=3154730 RepID=UPI00342E2202